MEERAFQLALLEPADAEWRLDEHTRVVGRRGVAACRQILARTPARPAV